MTRIELDRWWRDWEHRYQLRKIKADSDERIRQIREDGAKTRRAEESVTARLIEFNFKHPSPGRPVTLAEAKRFQRLRVARSGVVLEADKPFVEGWRRHIADEARRLGVTIDWCSACAGVNAYAFTATRRIECAPINSAEDYVDAGHEVRIATVHASRHIDAR